VDNTNKLTHISLCTGYGGIDLGLSRALGSVRSIAYVEIEAFSIINLVKKIEAGLMDSAPIFTDLKKFPWRPYRGKVDILSGGFPCQPFSAAGRRAGDEDPRHLWPYIVKGIRELGRPPIVFLENVEGIISSKLKGTGWRDREGTSVLLHVLRELERLGYKSTAGIFSAAEVGAPHQRKRVFILGVRDDLRESGYTIVSKMLEQNCGSSTAYPAPRGAEQYAWEPPRVTMGDTNSRGLQDETHEHQSYESKSRDKKTIGATRSRTSNRAKELGDSSLKRLEGSLSKSIARTKEEEPTTGSSTHGHLQRTFKPSMGRDIDGASNRLDHAELFESCDSRTDELRMLGNGVVPDTAKRAFQVLFSRLASQ
jgi:DNA-cytosine methyltransferase